MTDDLLRTKPANAPLVPSFQTAEVLRADMTPGAAVELAPGVVRLLADNAKDYTGPGTNTYLLGSDSLWIIDPGPACSNHLARLKTLIADRPVTGVFVTHSHMDHSPAAAPIKAWTGATVYGLGGLDPNLAALTDEDIDPDFLPDVSVKDGDRFDGPLGAATVLHTPGHFPNHLCLYVKDQGLLFSGDHVMGWSTTVVVPPLGHLADYLASLDKIDQIGARTLLPSHGLPVNDPKGRIAEIKEHRALRHIQIRAALDAGLTAIPDIVDRVYGDSLPCRLRAAAEGQVQAHIDLMNDQSQPLSLSA